ncbi:alpha/beta hydrolase [Aurantibacter crassamenti]|uniref:alpha/beta hydrolase n=1 Tax=Aurantibacter crassamenti TaxID=1837375 RepID=UPI00193ACBD1|nr:alpha/beta hydrolase [Aurantibacter crassamenti]MBM1105024.1 alpha/beta hydrolase [Aurantibacter crassamenti]
MKYIRKEIWVIIFIMFSYVSIGQTTKTYELLEFPNLSYLEQSEIANDSLQKLNLIIPQGVDNYPLFIWIGGGAWSYGDKNQEMDFAKLLAKRGMAVASIGHRLSPAIWRDSTLKTGITHPKHIEDIAASVKWLHDNAKLYGYNKKKIFIGGYSSGAHLAALISLDSSYLSKYGLNTTIFKGVVPISGTYDINNYYKVFLNGNSPELAEHHVKAVFGNDVTNYTQASPVNYLENLSFPMLLMCDNNLYNYTNLFEDKIRETNFREVQVVYAYNLTHGELWKNLSYADTSIYRELIIDFIDKQSIQ